MKKWLVGILAIICASMPLSVAPAEALPQENFDSMLPVMDSILRCCVENDMTYDAGNPEFFWSVLYYYCANWAKDDPECELVDGELRVPAERMKAYAKALFDGVESFPAPPADCVIRYDADWQSYFMSASDASENAIVVRSAYDQPNGSISVEAELIQLDGTPIAALHAFLVPDANGQESAEFPYSVSEALIEYE